MRFYLHVPPSWGFKENRKLVWISLSHTYVYIYIYLYICIYKYIYIVGIYDLIEVYILARSLSTHQITYTSLYLYIYYCPPLPHCIAPTHNATLPTILTCMPYIAASLDTPTVHCRTCKHAHCTLPHH